MDESQLASIDLFSSLSRRERREIANRAEEIDVAAGTHLVREGEFAYEFFVIREGSADVLREGEHIADLGPATSSARWESSRSRRATRRWWPASRRGSLC